MASEPPAKGARRTLRIGKYEVVKHIATGGMGAVYRAVDLDLGRPVALKILPPDLAANPLVVERFRREAKAAAKLRHENIVTIYEFEEDRGTQFLVLEFVEGTDLQAYITQKGRLEPEEARLLLLQAARALDHAHRQGIVHRDIKPSNFLVAQKDGQPLLKLTDLGLARETSEDEFRVTRDGTTVGTVDYMSPEQARNSGLADIRSDIYSLGCTFYHMLAGQAPFAEGSLTERIYKHVETEPEDIRTLNPAVDLGLARILRRMLEKKPADRHQTPAELIGELEHPDDSPETPRWEILARLSEGIEDRPKTRKAARTPPQAAAETDSELECKLDRKVVGPRKKGETAAGSGDPGRAQDGETAAPGQPSLSGRWPVDPYILAGAAFLIVALIVAGWVIISTW